MTLLLDRFLLGLFALIIGQAIVGIRWPRHKRFILSLWAGLAVLQWGALGFSFFPPMSFYLFAIVAAVVAVIYFRRDLIILPSLPQLFSIAIIMAAVAPLASHLRPTPDTFEYHVPMIEWLRAQGTTLGMANESLKFATITSDWNEATSELLELQKIDIALRSESESVLQSEQSNSDVVADRNAANASVNGHTHQASEKWLAWFSDFPTKQSEPESARSI